jgi:hypothetical protein
MPKLLVAVIAWVVLMLAACTATPPPSNTLVATATPQVTSAQTPEPSEQPTPTSSPWVPCGPQILVRDTTGQLLTCQDIGTVAIVNAAPHVANVPADPTQLRIWWSVDACATEWWLDISQGASGLPVIDLKDVDHAGCPNARRVGRALTLEFRPMVSASQVLQLHNGGPVISVWPTSTLPPTPTMYPSTPSSIQFGHWDTVVNRGQLTRKSTEVTVVVREQACASGKSPEGRILEPFVAYDTRYVWVSFAIWSLPGVQSCERGPGVPYTVHLSQPLGRRALHDGGVIFDGWGGPYLTRCPIRSPQNYC